VKRLLLLISLLMLSGCITDSIGTTSSSNSGYKTFIVTVPSEATNYTLYFSDGIGFYSKTMSSNNTKINVKDLNLTVNGIYSFYVKANNDAGQSDKSNVLNCRVIK
jgi:hypothetical protein